MDTVYSSSEQRRSICINHKVVELKDDNKSIERKAKVDRHELETIQQFQDMVKRGF